MFIPSICPQQAPWLHLLVHWVLDALALSAQPLALLPAHLHEHLVANVLHCQFELLVL